MSAIAEHVYKRTAVGAKGALTYGGVSDDQEGRRRFEAEVAELEDMAVRGLVEILDKREDDQSGARGLTSVLFRRLC